jgi:hypothetical protein
MVNADKFHVEGAEAYYLSSLNALEIGLVRRLQLLQLILNYSESQLCSVYGGFMERRTYGTAPT